MGQPGFFLFMQEGQEQSEKIIRDELGAFGSGVDAVILNGAGDGVDVGVELGQERHAESGGDEAVGLIELLDVVGAVVGRKGDAGEDDFASGLEQGGDDGGEVAARVGDGDATETVVAAEFNDDDGRGRRRTSMRRSTPSLVVLPLTPALTIL